MYKTQFKTFLSILGLALCASCSAVNFFSSETKNGGERPSEESEGIPGYLVNPDQIAVYKGSQGNTYVVSTNNFLKNEGVSELYAIMTNKEDIPRSIKDLRERFNESTRAQFSNDLGFTVKTPTQEGQEILLLAIVGVDGVSATYVDLSEKRDHEVSFMNRTEGLCTVSELDAPILQSLETVFADAYVSCESTATNLESLTDQLEDFVCQESEGFECKEVRHLPLARSCAIAPSGEPENMQCAISLDSTESSYLSRQAFIDAMNQFSSKTASWISIHAPVTVERVLDNLTRELLQCQDQSTDDRLVLVNNFALAKETTLQVETILDDAGSLRIWKDGDSSQEVLAIVDTYDGTLPVPPDREYYLSQEVVLEAGHYIVVMDVIDFNDFAHTAVATFTAKDSSKVLLQTGPDQDWCGFDLNRSTNISEFLSQSATCLKCFNGRGSFR